MALGSISFNCARSGAMLRGMSICTRPNRGITFMNTANTNGAAVAGLVGHFCSVTSNGVECSNVGVGGVGGTSLHHSLNVILRRAGLFANAIVSGVHCNELSTASRRYVSTTHLTNTSSFVTELPRNCSAVLAGGNSGLSRKRHRLVTVTHTTITSPPIVVLSRTASSVSAQARTVMRGNVSGLVRNEAMFIVTRHLSAIGGSSIVVILSRNEVVRHNSRRGLVRRGNICCRLCANTFRLRWFVGGGGQTIVVEYHGRNFRGG